MKFKTFEIEANNRIMFALALQEISSNVFKGLKEKQANMFEKTGLYYKYEYEIEKDEI